MALKFAQNILPAILFPALAAVGATLMFQSLYPSGLVAKMEAQCPPEIDPSVPYRISYTGSEGVDMQLCSVIAFFHFGMEPGNIDYISYFLSTSSWLFIVPFLEGYRQGQGYLNILVSFPVITGVLLQTVSAALTVPIYWTAFLLGGNARMSKGRSALITQAHAESLVFGTIAGIIIPSVGLMIFKDPIVTAIWQLVPIWSYIAQKLHLLIRAPQTNSGSGYELIKWMFLILFMVASSSHIAILYASMQEGLITSPIDFFLPSFKEQQVAAMSRSQGVINALQIDLGTSWISSILATFWFGSTTQECLGLLAWHVVAIPLAGPGASFLGAALWREYKLNEQTEREMAKVMDKKN